jgi:4-hydroxy-tetrahydrodipicolinate synthase
MKKLSGIYTALVTPFKKGKIDEEAFAGLIKWQIAKGVHGLVPCGTTGESATLTMEEHKALIALCVDAAKGRVPVMAGAGANSTAEAIELTQAAEDAGAEAVLSVTPYYNKPSQEGLYRHFKAIHDATAIPIILYNIPGRAAVDMSDDVIAKLSELPRIVGIKDATGNLGRVCTIRAKAGQEFVQFSGDDITAVGYNAMGGTGCISVSSNVAPARCAEIQTQTLKGDYKKARQLQDTLVELHQAMFCEPSPAPVKYALSLMNKCSAETRLPIVPLSTANRKRVRDALLGAGLI